MTIVFDIGASHMRAAALRGDDMGPVAEVPTPQDCAPAMEALCSLIRGISAREDVETIAGGTAGTVANGRIVKPSPFLPAWGECNVAGFVQRAFPGARVAVENDADVGCMGEARRGAGKGYTCVAYVCIGTGIGSARATHGVIDTPEGFKTGEQVMEHGQTLEMLVGGKAIVERYGKKFADLAPEDYEAVMDVLAAGLRNTVEAWSPNVLVLGGALPFARPDFLETIQKKTAAPIVLAAFGESSVLYGASEL